MNSPAPRHETREAYTARIRAEIAAGTRPAGELIAACNRALPPAEAQAAIAAVMLPLIRHGHRR